MTRPITLVQYAKANSLRPSALNPNGWNKRQWQVHYKLSPLLADTFWELMRLSEDDYASWEALASAIYHPSILKRLAGSGYYATHRAVQRLRPRIAHGLYSIHTLNTVGVRLVRKGSGP